MAIFNKQPKPPETESFLGRVMSESEQKLDSSKAVAKVRQQPTIPRKESSARPTTIEQLGSKFKKKNQVQTIQYQGRKCYIIGLSGLDYVISGKINYDTNTPVLLVAGEELKE